MKTQFSTEEGAQLALKHARAKGLGWCPLIKHECRVDCICYYKGIVIQNSFRKGEWNMHRPTCTSLLISNDRVI